MANQRGKKLGKLALEKSRQASGVANLGRDKVEVHHAHVPYMYAYM